MSFQVFSGGPVTRGICRLLSSYSLWIYESPVHYKLYEFFYYYPVYYIVHR